MSHHAGSIGSIGFLCSCDAAGTCRAADILEELGNGVEGSSPQVLLHGRDNLYQFIMSMSPYETSGFFHVFTTVQYSSIFLCIFL